MTAVFWGFLFESIHTWFFLFGYPNRELPPCQLLSIPWYQKLFLPVAAAVSSFSPPCVLCIVQDPVAGGPFPSLTQQKAAAMGTWAQSPTGVQCSPTGVQWALAVGGAGKGQLLMKGKMVLPPWICSLGCAVSFMNWKWKGENVECSVNLACELLVRLENFLPLSWPVRFVKFHVVLVWWGVWKTFRRFEAHSDHDRCLFS